MGFGLDVESRFGEVKGYGRIRYLELGTGRPLILVHGSPYWAEIWYKNIGPLSKRFHVFVPDVVGHGQSEKPEADYSYDFFKDFAKAFMNSVGIAKAALAGSSIGGIIALACAALYPKRVTHLILADSGPGFGKEASVGARLATIPLIGKALIPARRWRCEIELRRYSVYDKEIIEERIIEQMLDYLKKGADKTYYRFIKANCSLRGWKKEILNQMLVWASRVKAPTLIVWGRNDKILPVSQGKTANEYIKGSTLRIFEKCGHLPFFEKPVEFNRLLIGFGARLDCQVDKQRSKQQTDTRGNYVVNRAT